MSSGASEEVCLRQLVENMFRDVFTADERADLLVRITAWEEEHPNSSAHVRVTAWIDIAYEFQARRPAAHGSAFSAVHLAPRLA